MGQFGVIGAFEDFFPNITTDDAWYFLYTDFVQEYFSAANYWNDPFHHNAYLEYVSFLTLFNNQTQNPYSSFFKANFQKVFFFFILFYFDN